MRGKTIGPHDGLRRRKRPREFCKMLFMVSTRDEQRIMGSIADKTTPTASTCGLAALENTHVAKPTATRQSRSPAESQRRQQRPDCAAILLFLLLLILRVRILRGLRISSGLLTLPGWWSVPSSTVRSPFLLRSEPYHSHS
jgi:hypothetical protein